MPVRFEEKVVTFSGGTRRFAKNLSTSPRRVGQAATVAGLSFRRIRVTLVHISNSASILRGGENFLEEVASEFTDPIDD